MLILAFIPELYVGGSYLRVGIILGGLVLLLESINSSANIFIYYHMSSKYRTVFQTLFCKQTDKVSDIAHKKEGPFERSSDDRHV